jgi:formamidopyrimidine-DNA glycosylase
MPELPEVETVRRGLEHLLMHKTITHVDVIYPPIVENDISRFLMFKNQNIEAVKRFGKYLVLLTTDYALVIHLRMEGRFYIKKDQPIDKHEHVIFHLDDHTNLRYHDVRKFGRILIRDKHQYLNQKPLNQLAGEPQDLEEISFWKILKRKNRAIKTVLLDQTIVAGLGNIYVDETLFLCQIHPEKKANTITKSQAKQILNHASSVLKKATELGGSTIRTYQSTLGIDGRFQNELLVHTKVGMPCPSCHNEIIKIKVGGRGTYVCTICQKR